PKPGGAVKIEKSAGPASCGLFQHEMTVQENGLGACQPGIRPVNVPPPRSNHANLRIRKIIDTIFKDVWRRDEIGIQNEEKFAICFLKTVVQSSGLKTHAILSPQDNRVIASLAQFGDFALRNLVGFIRRIVQNLNL